MHENYHLFKSLNFKVDEVIFFKKKRKLLELGGGYQGFGEIKIVTPGISQ